MSFVLAIGVLVIFAVLTGIHATGGKDEPLTRGLATASGFLALALAVSVVL